MPDIPVTATIGFELRGQPGRVVIRYGLNEDPDRWGYPLLGLKPLTEVSRGFPVVQAEVVHPAEGYGAVLSWIQIIRSTNGESAERMHYVDRAPQLEGLDLPYYSFGMRPILFDAPSTTAREMSWNAHALLAVSPDCVISRRVQALCGFAWGYRVVGGQPRPAPLTVFGSPAAWREDLEFLGSRHPLWSFC